MLIKLLLTYDVKDNVAEEYRQFVLGEFVLVLPPQAKGSHGE